MHTPQIGYIHRLNQFRMWKEEVSFDQIKLICRSGEGKSENVNEAKKAINLVDTKKFTYTIDYRHKIQTGVCGAFDVSIN